MVIVFGVELSAVDQAHRHLKSFVEGGCLLKFCRRASEGVDELGTTTPEFRKNDFDGPLLMSFRQLLKPRSHCSRVRLSSLTQILESLLPKFLNVG